MKVLRASDIPCPVSGKGSYGTEDAANGAIETAWLSRSWRNTHGQPPTRAYLCPDCGYWHLTSATIRLPQGDDQP